MLGKKHEVLAFLAWVSELPSETHPAYPETKRQLVQTFYFLTATYGLTILEKDLTAFEAAALKNAAFRAPCVFFPCRDRPDLHLAFDWATWLRGSGYLLEP